MQHYEYTLNTLVNTPNYDALKNYVANMLTKMTDDVLNGQDKEVEKRYKYYIMNEL